MEKYFYYQQLLIEKIPKGWIKDEVFGKVYCFYNSYKRQYSPKNFYPSFNDNGLIGFKTNIDWSFSFKKRPFWIQKNQTCYDFQDKNMKSAIYIKKLKNKIKIGNININRTIK